MTMHSNLIMYLTAMSAVSIHNLANNIKEATRSYESIDLKTQATNWTFEDTSNLIAKYPQCAGSKQSPVLIDNSMVQDNLNLRLGLTAYDKPMSGFLVNQFPTFRVVPFSHEWPRPSALISNSLARSFNPYADSHFVLNYVQFYWRPANEPDEQPERSSWPVHQLMSSNHTLSPSNQALNVPLEIHFVHTNTAYSNLNEALSRPDGLLIFAVMVVPSTHESYIFNRALDELANLTEHGQQVAFNEDSTWRSLLPSDTSKFYRYHGSLVMPPCHESVKWIVFDEKLKLGHKQLKRLGRFRFLAEIPGGQPKRVTIDWAAQRRPLQALNKRTIERSFRPSARTQRALRIGGRNKPINIARARPVS